MHSEDGLVDITPLDQVLEDEGSGTKVEKSLEERHGSKHGLHNTKGRDSKAWSTGGGTTEEPCSCSVVEGDTECFYSAVEGGRPCNYSVVRGGRCCYYSAVVGRCLGLTFSG